MIVVFSLVVEWLIYTYWNFTSNRMLLLVPVLVLHLLLLLLPIRRWLLAVWLRPLSFLPYFSTCFISHSCFSSWTARLHEPWILRNQLIDRWKAAGDHSCTADRKTGANGNMASATKGHITPLYWEGEVQGPSPPLLFITPQPPSQTTGHFPAILRFWGRPCPTFSEEGGCPGMFTDGYLGNHKLLDHANGCIVFGVQKSVGIWMCWCSGQKGELMDSISSKEVILLRKILLWFHHFWVVHSYNSCAFFASRPFYDWHTMDFTADCMVNLSFLAVAESGLLMCTAFFVFCVTWRVVSV